MVKICYIFVEKIYFSILKILIFFSFMKYSRNLEFTETPDYKLMTKNFEDLMRAKGWWPIDWQFDWIEKLNKINRTSATARTVNTNAHLNTNNNNVNNAKVASINNTNGAVGMSNSFLRANTNSSTNNFVSNTVISSLNAANNNNNKVAGGTTYRSSSLNRNANTSSHLSPGAHLDSKLNAVAAHVANSNNNSKFYENQINQYKLTRILNYNSRHN